MDGYHINSAMVFSNNAWHLNKYPSLRSRLGCKNGIKMFARRGYTPMSFNTWLALSLFAILVITFILYIRAEKQVDHANNLRHRSLLLTNEFRQTSDDLTHMARSYVATGDLIYQQLFDHIIAVRDGQIPRSSTYHESHWELALAHQQPPTGTGPRISQLELMRNTGFSEQELEILTDVLAKSNEIAATERAAMALIKPEGTPDSQQRKALSMVFDENYNRAKAGIVKPLNSFYRLIDQRTLNAVRQAEQGAAILRSILIGFGLSLMFMLWRISRTLRATLGGSIHEVHNQITHIGKGNFSGPALINDAKENTVLGWLVETGQNLHKMRQERARIEGEKEQSDARYRKLFESASVGIVIFVSDLDKTLIDCNEHFCTMLGYSLDEIRNLHLSDVIAPTQVDEVAHAIKTIATKNTLFREWLLKRKDSSVFAAEVLSTNMPDGTMISIVRDITSRKQAQERLRRSEEDLAITLQSIGDGVIATDAQGHIIRMNPIAERMTGWPLNESLGKPLDTVFRIIDARTRVPQNSPVELVISSGQVVSLASHTVLVARDNTEYHISDSAAPIRDSAGTIVGVVLVFSDVSERYQSEAALRTANERIRRTFKLIPDLVTLQTVEGVLVDCSDAFCEATGFSRDEIINRNSLELGLWVDADERRRMRVEVSKNGEIDNFEFRLRRRNGEIRIMQLSARLIDEDTDPILLTVGHDITEQKLAEEAVRQNERFIATLAHNIPGMVSHWTRELRCNFANKGYLQWFGKTAEELGAAKPEEIVGQELFNLNLPFLQAALDGVAQSVERTMPGPDGRNAQVCIQYIPDREGGQIEGIFVVITDITERKQSELALRESVQHTQAILDNMFDGVITLNPEGIIESINTSACSIFGYQQEEVLGRKVTLLMPDDYKSQYEFYLRHHDNTLDDDLLNNLREVEGLRKNGETFPVSLSITKVLRDERITFIGVIRDISQQRQDEEEIYRLAFYDPLTNLPNRRLLYDRLQQAMITSSRTDQHGALMFLDLDYFKQLNDSLGHDLGDILLQQVAIRLQSCVREGDSVARMGGDEFVMLIEALSPYPNEAAAQAEMIAHKVLQALSQPYTLREHSYVTTPSIGIVIFLHQTDSMEELLKKADVAMYQAKTAGRNTARFFDPTMQAAVSVRVELEKSMRNALERKEFLLHYQLQVDRSGTPIGVEALVRWKHGKHGLISPGAFIPLAEETGIILPLGQWVLETACLKLVEWSKSSSAAHWCMSVNVSITQFAHPDFVTTVTNALQKTGANPHQLKLELTESMLAKDVEEVIVKMVEIKTLGVTFALDDFGTGYSSLSYLKRLPLDQLKIDQTFVRDLLTDSNDATIARTVVALGHSLGLGVIAEGVETPEQRDALAEMGCDAYQGYYFARPMDAKDLELAVNNLPR
jgi:diguanylate cyclase (GGDEF)-like protein/PAS domain S-box-containing protein